MKKAKITDFLTPAQIQRCEELWREHNWRAKNYIQAEVIEPNMEQINKALGQENDPTYITYSVIYVLCNLE